MAFGPQKQSAALQCVWIIVNHRPSLAPELFCLYVCFLSVRNNNVNRKFDQRTDGSSKLIRHYKAGHRKSNEED